MARLIFLLLVSIALHIWFFWEARPEPQVAMSAGTISAPVSLNFISAAVSAPPPAKPTEAEKKPEPVPEKKVIEKPKKKAVEKAVAVKKPEPKPEQKREQKSEPQQQASAPKTAQAGVSDKPPLLEQPTFRSPPQPPQYPRRAKRTRQQGIVQVEAWLNTRGDVVRADILKSSGFPMLDQAALQAVQGWRFEPLRQDGVAMASRVIAPVGFQIN